MNPEVIIKIFDSPQLLAESMAVEFKKICVDVILKRDEINIAISGGNTPKLLFQVLGRFYKDKIDWRKVNFFWVDERCVPPEDPESNYGMIKDNFFNEIDIPPENIHRILGENIPNEESARYSEILKTRIKNNNNFPQFDLLLLGVGDDGHTASIFPDQMMLLDSEKYCEVAVNPCTFQKRITITGNVINNSERIYLLVIGKNKNIIIKNILEKKNNYLQYPAAHIRNDHGQINWYIDREASEFLKL